MISSANTQVGDAHAFELEVDRHEDVSTLTPELLSMVGGGDGMVNI